MRIRKRSTLVKAANSSTKTTADEEAEAVEKEFLLPLVAAAMDVQSKDEVEVSGIHAHPANNWRNALERCNPEIEAVQAEQEGNKSNIGIIRRNREDKFGLLTGEVACVKEGTSSSLEREISDVEEKNYTGVGTLRKKRSIQDSQATKCHIKRTGRKETIHNDESKTQSKSESNDNNYYAGSQCRRRNGRGWRCSQRTLVGYSLCEHHLGKGRLKSINTGNGAAYTVNYKEGSKFKELRLIHAAAPPCKVECAM